MKAGHWIIGSGVAFGIAVVLTAMTDKAIRPLRRRMIEDMTIRNFAPKTQASDIRAVRNFTVFLGRSPDQARGCLRHP